MRISVQSTISASERALRQLDQTVGDEPLRLPTNIRHVIGGAEAMLAQVIITWAQRSANPRLETFISSASQIDDFVRRLPGLVAALCASEAVGMSLPDSIFEDLRSAALKRLKQVQGKQPKQGYRGSSAEILCADHLGRSAPYLLYVPDQRGGSRLRPRENFRDLARWLLAGAIPKEYRALIDAEATEAIGAMLFEIFKNTEDHALVDAAGDLLGISIRAIKTNHHAIKPEHLERIVEGFGPLRTYCKSLTTPLGAVQTHLFELSILDSGPGFAVTWTGRPLDQLSYEEEENAVRACFGRGSAKRQSHFGEGLPHVLRLLSRHAGFLRLRTGRLSFYIDFSVTDKVNGATLLCRHESEDALALAPAAGSLLTILIPMRRSS